MQRPRNSLRHCSVDVVKSGSDSSGLFTGVGALRFQSPYPRRKVIDVEYYSFFFMGCLAYLYCMWSDTVNNSDAAYMTSRLYGGRLLHEP